jgi:hypothetical protein
VNDREKVHAEIVHLAKVRLGVGPETVANSLSMTGNSYVPGIERVRSMFLDVFVSQALDQMTTLLEQDKEYIAGKAAEYARALAERGVELVTEGVEHLKSALGVTPDQPVADRGYG